MLITPTEHDKREWARFANACYGQDLNAYGHRYSAAACLRRGEQLAVYIYDQLQRDYRSWLVSGEYPWQMGE